MSSAPLKEVSYRDRQQGIGRGLVISDVGHRTSAMARHAGTSQEKQSILNNVDHLPESLYVAGFTNQAADRVCDVISTRLYEPEPLYKCMFERHAESLIELLNTTDL
jgi:hypothetical protein